MSKDSKRKFCYCMQHSNCYLSVKNIDHNITSLNMGAI